MFRKECRGNAQIPFRISLKGEQSLVKQYNTRLKRNLQHIYIFTTLNYPFFLNIGHVTSQNLQYTYQIALQFNQFSDTLNSNIV